jgi:hypothetical protein
LLSIKIIGAMLLVGAAMAALFLFLRPILTTTSVVDQGPRGLVVVATSGGDRDYDLRLNSHVDERGRYKLTFYFTVDDVRYGADGQPGFAVNYHITFAGDLASEGVSCGTSTDPIPRESFSDLSGGTQAALRIDAVAAPNSAMNFDGSGGGRIDVEARRYPDFRGQIWVVDKDETSYSDRFADGEYAFAESCVLPEKAVWRRARDAGPGEDERRTLLVPQFNLTSLGDTTDYQRDMFSWLLIDRAPNMSLSEAYPSPRVRDDSWVYESPAYWYGRRGEVLNVRYTDQPVFIFSDRDLPTKQALLLLGAGAVLGIIGTLVTTLLSRLVDVGWSWLRDWATRG